MKTQNPADIDVFNDHVHSFKWFSTSNINNHLVFTNISAEVAVDRHGGTAHYLYGDGHVELISQEQINEWADSEFDFARPIH